MARIAIILPRDDMLQPARKAAERYHLNVMGIYAVHNSNVLEKTEEVVRAGADIIIARGIQAMLIKRNTTVSLVEIQLTNQEMVQLLHKAESLVDKAHPVVGLVGYSNMFCDMRGLDQLLGVELKTYFVKQIEQMREAVSQARVDGVDVLIGGDIACTAAAELGLPSVFMVSGLESLEEACRVTRHVAYTLDQEKRNAAELKAVLDYTVNGLIRVDADGIVRNLNHSAQQALGTTEAQALGLPLSHIIPALTEKAMEPVLSQGQELYSIPLKLGSTPFMATLSPVLMGENVTGAILSITEGRQLELYATEQRKELLRQGFTAPFTFDTIVARSPQSQSLLEQARRYAKFSLPILLLGEFGTEKEELAQCIHNAGGYSDRAFLHFNCDGPDPESITQRLFGPEGLLRHAQGVLFLNEVSRLSSECQYLLYRLIFGRGDSSYGTLEPPSPPLRILAADSGDPAELVRAGVLREDLYYALTAMVLPIPPLRQRPEDVLGWTERFLHELQQRHGRYVHLTQGAWQRLSEYPWPGNLAQLRNLCERIIVESPRRTVDELFLEGLLRLSGPLDRADPPAQTSVVYCDPKAARISELLRIHHGSRKAVAQELGVSVTTLWRHMKKYGIKE